MTKEVEIFDKFYAFNSKEHGDYVMCIPVKEKDVDGVKYVGVLPITDARITWVSKDEICHECEETVS